jgi:cation diffusion facilitator CzcD-associated flavoprotein CzcO
MKNVLEVDAVVVGAGLGGIYAVHKLRERGLKVIGLEAASGVGGVWRHNAYPGARVDLDSIIYSYHFSPEIYRSWRWKERYAAQPQLLAYLEYVADRLGVVEHFRFNSPLRGAQWRPETARYELVAGEGLRLTTRFLVMATGNLSAPRDIPFPGAERYRGELLISSRWPERDIDFRGRRVAVVGAGSSGVQCATALAGVADHLYVFQRSPHYSIPARNGPLDEEWFDSVAADSLATRHRHFHEPPSDWIASPLKPKAAKDCTPEEKLERMETQYAFGGQFMGFVFTDQNTDRAVSDLVSDFVRNKIRQRVSDPVLAEKLIPHYPYGTRRISLDIGYSEIFSRPDVTLADGREDPIQEFTEAGIRTRDREYELDAIILALGFKAFRGELENANIRNEHGLSVTSRWSRGPRTLLGLMTLGFPNLFMLASAGSPAVLSNLFTMNEYHVEWVVRCIDYMDAHGHATIQPSEEAEDRWTRHVTEVARAVAPIRLAENQYMTHVNEDGTRVFMPYAAGMARYVEAAEQVVANGYEGFKFSRAPSPVESA